MLSEQQEENLPVNPWHFIMVLVSGLLIRTFSARPLWHKALRVRALFPHNVCSCCTGADTLNQQDKWKNSVCNLILTDNYVFHPH